MSFEKNVFINCPFDSEYWGLLAGLIFTTLDLGFEPRLALECNDSGRPRLAKIIQLIEESRYGIHDLSRCQASEAEEFYRLNMPLELGLDLGCRLFKNKKWKEKKILVLEKKKYRYQAAISDLAGSDIEHHNDNVALLIKIVIDWLMSEKALDEAPSPDFTLSRYHRFQTDLFATLKRSGDNRIDLHSLPIPRLILQMKKWIIKNESWV